MSKEKRIGKGIKFHFHPNRFDENKHTITKADESGNKRRYLCGISSGLDIDAHGERMTEKCIKSFMDQSNSGDVLLFADIHGIKESEDIGLLSKGALTPQKEWYTEFRLYDQFDEVGQMKLEKADNIWKQVNGLPPYNHKKQKGFSIEGIIPEENIIMNSLGEMDRSVIDDVMLDGVILVPRPAYKNSIATAICKALGEINPYRAESIQNTLRENVEQQDIENNYYSLKWKYLDALEQTVERIMTRARNSSKRSELEVLFDEFKPLMINLILNSESMFAEQQDGVQIEIDGSGNADQELSASIEEEDDNDPKLELFKSLYSELRKLEKTLEK